jgi:hypothetical protein
MKHGKSIAKATFNKYENLILTLSHLGTARLWHAHDGSPVFHPIIYSGTFYGATFSKHRELLLTWGRLAENGCLWIWDTNADYDFPAKNLPLLVEVTTGTKMDDFGNLFPLSQDEWMSKKKIYTKIAEKHLGMCKYRHANLYLQQKTE